MPQREFANQKRLMEYAEQNGLAYLWDGTPAFVKWRRLLSHEEYEIVNVRTSRGVRRAMLFPKGLWLCISGQPKALGLTVPLIMQMTADEVIE